MDSQLETRLRDIEAQIKKLAKVERKYLGLEGARKTTFAILYSKSEKRSISDKQYDVEASLEWGKYMELLTEAEADYLNEKRTLDLLFKVYDAEHLSLKVDHPAIRRQGA